MTHRYKRAFYCRRCPERNDENGCPMWWVDTWENEQTGEVKPIAACGFTLLPQYLKWTSGRAALAAISMNQVRDAVHYLPVALKQLSQSSQGQSQKEIEYVKSETETE